MDIVDRIINMVEKEFKLEPGEIKGYSRLKHTSRARMIAMYVARFITYKSLHEIAKVFNKDHTSVSWAWKRINVLRKQDVATDELVTKIINLLVFELWDCDICLVQR